MRILFTTTRGTGHFGPLVPFARACVGAGHEVLVAAAPPVASLADGAELPFRALPEPPEDELAAVWERVFSLPPEQRDDYVIREIFAACHARAALLGTLATIEDVGPGRRRSRKLRILRRDRGGAPGSPTCRDRRVPLGHATTIWSRISRHRSSTSCGVGVGLGPDPGAWALRRAPLLTQAPRSLDDPTSPTAVEV